MNADSFHRLAKVLVDAEEVTTIEELNDTFNKYGVRIKLDESFASNECAQIIGLTAINAAARSFIGNVDVIAPSGIKLSVRGYEGVLLTDFLSWVGIGYVESRATWPLIAISSDGAPTRGSSIKPWAGGWRFGLGDREDISDDCFPPACVAAGGLAVSEAFSILRKDNAYAGRRSIDMSLWLSTEECIGNEAPTRGSYTVPSAWLVGLGHLGQAYAWTMGFMSPATDSKLFLQDFDEVTQSTLSTSMISSAVDVGRKKARVAANWLEQRGYATSIIERQFNSEQRIGASEPTIGLFGVDNAAARRVLEGAGFRLVIDAGLGAGHKDFRAIRVRTFPGPSSAAQIWADGHNTSIIPLAGAYKTMLADGADPCGVTTLASRAVGAPFVGCVAAAYTLAEFIRYDMGGDPSGYVDLNLRDPHAFEVGCVG